MTESTDHLKQQSWVDSQNRRWSTAIRAIDAVRLRESAGIDLLDPKSMEKIFGGNPLERFEVMAELARDHWTSKGLAYTDFSDALLSTPSSFIDATAALRVSIADFFRRLGRVDLATVVDRAWQVMEIDQKMRTEKAGGTKVGQILQAAADRSAADVEAELDKALAGLQLTHGPTFGDSVGSAVPTGGG